MSDPFSLDDHPAGLPESPPAGPRGPAGNPPAPGAPYGLSYLDQLNDAQRQAVETTEGPVLVLAGAGTGKTRVLTTRLAHILIKGHARPWDLLAVTFTNKAARQMQNRVASLLGRPTEGWWIGTFHAIGARILRQHAETVGLTGTFTILDADDQVRLLKQLLAAHEIDEKRWPARILCNIIQRWKDRGLTPEKVSDAEGAEFANGKALDLYKEYQARLVTLNAADFGDLLLHNLTLFQNNPDILKKYQHQFRYILVDEYQDTNVAQYLWLRLLAQEHKNICCVGDDDQSIYSWRGAEVGNILRFEDDFPGAAVIRLECNYRSTPHILGAASGLIAHNADRLGKTLWTEHNEGEKVRIVGLWDGEEEARYIGGKIEALHAKKHRLNEIAVLVRAGFQTREFEERLITLGIPYRVIGGPRFYERQEIRDAVAYLRVIAQPADDLAFERIMNVPKRGLGHVTAQTLHRLARAQGDPMSVAAAKLIETDELKPKARASLAALVNDFARWRTLAGGVPPSELAAMVLDEAGYMDMWKQQKTLDAPGRLDNLKELVFALEEFETLRAFLDHVSLVMENDDSADDDKVSLMTLHAAKGLEFETVFLPGWEEGLLPHQLSLDEGGVSGLEEERRLAHVGLTRARRRAVVCFAANRRIYGNWQSAIPSRFIDELPPENVTVESESGLYGSGGTAKIGGGFSDGGSFRHQGRSGNRRKKTRAIEAVDWDKDIVQLPEHYRSGQRVFHQKFGYGHVKTVDGNKLEIEFEKAGTKKVMDAFVEAV
ncbi:MAG: UvrD-helicase domain-containing protein [Rhodospirillales bacterium]